MTDINTQNCVEFWRRLREKIKKFDTLDDVELVFGARTRGQGHDYKLLPRVTDEEILAFERNNGFDLPVEYRTYLQEFGAGGAGPDYGICDYRQYVMPRLFQTRFPYTEEVYYDEAPDDDPIWDYPGLARICERGCGTGYLLELNGAAPGRVWCDWAEACSPCGSFLALYREWAEKVEFGLERYHLMKSFIDEKTSRLTPKGLTLDDVAAKLQCAYQVRGGEWNTNVAEGEKWVYFDKTPARVIINEKRDVIQIDVFQSCSIT